MVVGACTFNVLLCLVTAAQVKRRCNTATQLLTAAWDGSQNGNEPGDGQQRSHGGAGVNDGIEDSAVITDEVLRQEFYKSIAETHRDIVMVRHARRMSDEYERALRGGDSGYSSPCTSPTKDATGLRDIILGYHGGRSVGPIPNY